MNQKMKKHITELRNKLQQKRKPNSETDVEKSAADEEASEESEKDKEVGEDMASFKKETANVATQTVGGWKFF